VPDTVSWTVEVDGPQTLQNSLQARRTATRRARQQLSD
jgi:hypothetical protein